MTHLGRCLVAISVGCLLAWFTNHYLTQRRMPSAPPPPLPAVRVAPASVVIDGTSDGEGGRRTFTLTNDGGKTVTILEIDVGCSACTSLLEGPSARSLAPGESVLRLDPAVPSTGAGC
ncbi:MAG: hypothetical protein JWO38_2149 [Gemmataceae bacterium]|nr:hypothetical protein [Gemmataceae bacterium]